MSYCSFCRSCTDDNVHRYYHDHHYGFPPASDDELFGRLVLEIFQAGLSWDTVLKKAEHITKVFDNFSIEQIRLFSDKRLDELMQDPGIIRHRKKLEAIRYNAIRVHEIQQKHGSFEKWIYEGLTRDKKKNLLFFKKAFKFVGEEIVNEWMLSTSFYAGAHEQNCPIFAKVMKSQPFWRKIEQR